MKILQEEGHSTSCRFDTGKETKITVMENINRWQTFVGRVASLIDRYKISDGIRLPNIDLNYGVSAVIQRVLRLTVAIREHQLSKILALANVRRIKNVNLTFFFLILKKNLNKETLIVNLFLPQITVKENIVIRIDICK